MDPSAMSYFALKGAIGDLPQDERRKLDAAEAQLREILRITKPYGHLAMTLIVGELAMGKAEVRTKK